MKKSKLYAAVGIIAILAIAVWGINRLLPKKIEGEKVISIVIRDDMDHKTLFEGVVKTDATTMYGLLTEAKELQVKLEKSTYGNFIVSMKGVNQGDISSGPWWLYESDNNESCTSAGMCPGIDELAIQDGDVFVFKLTDAFE